jgi:hypothetical protein
VYLVLCYDWDVPGLWAYQKLRTIGLAPIELVTARSLALAKTWEHRLGQGGVYLKVSLHDGRLFDSSEIRGVLNRLTSIPQDLIGRAVAEDREYVQGELIAFYLSWLGALQCVINRPTPQGLAGSWRHRSEWALLAAKAGLNTPLYQQSSASRPEDGYGSFASPDKTVAKVIVLNNELFGSPLPRDVGEACRKLAAHAETNLLGVDLFDAGNGAFMFAHATPFPDLTLGGDDLIEALAGILRADHDHDR